LYFSLPKKRGYSEEPRSLAKVIFDQTLRKKLDITYLLKGLAIGFSIAAPVGPIGVLCIRRTLSEGRASGLVSGLGAATADTSYQTL